MTNKTAIPLTHATARSVRKILKSTPKAEFGLPRLKELGLFRRARELSSAAGEAAIPNIELGKYLKRVVSRSPLEDANEEALARLMSEWSKEVGKGLAVGGAAVGAPLYGAHKAIDAYKEGSEKKSSSKGTRNIIARILDMPARAAMKPLKDAVKLPGALVSKYVDIGESQARGATKAVKGAADPNPKDLSTDVKTKAPEVKPVAPHPSMAPVAAAATKGQYKTVKAPQKQKNKNAMKRAFLAASLIKEGQSSALRKALAGLGAAGVLGTAFFTGQEWEELQNKQEKDRQRREALRRQILSRMYGLRQGG